MPEIIPASEFQKLLTEKKLVANDIQSPNDSKESKTPLVIPKEEFKKALEDGKLKTQINGVATADYDRSALEQKISKIRESIYNDTDLRDDFKKYLMDLRLNNAIDDTQLEEVKKTLKGQQPEQQEDNWWTRGVEGAIAGAGVGATVAGVSGLVTEGVSTAAGAVIGGAIGGIAGAVRDDAHFYIDDQGIPRPLGYGQRAPKGNKINSVYSSFATSEDDNAVTALAKSATNSILDSGRAIPALAQLLTGVVTGDQFDSKFLNEIENQVESYHFELDPKASQQIISVDKDGVGLNADNMNWHSAMALVGQAVGSMASFLGAGNAMSAQKEMVAAEEAFVAAKRAKLGLAADAAIPELSMADQLALRSPWKNPRNYGASILISMTEAADAAEQAGIKGRKGSLFALASGIGVGALELMIGGAELNIMAKRKILTEAAGQLASKTAKTVVTGAGKVEVKALEQEGLNQIYDQIQKAGLKTIVREGLSNVVKSMAHTGVEEGTEEFIQGLYSQTIQQLSDKFGGTDKKYGTDSMSWQSGADNLNNFLGGLAGAPLGAFNQSREENINKSISREVALGRGNKLALQLIAARDGKQISQQDLDIALSRIKTMQEYHEGTKQITKDMPLTAKQELLNNLFQKSYAMDQQALYDQQVAANPKDAIAQAHADVYKQEVNSYQSKIEKILSTPIEKLHEEDKEAQAEEQKKTETEGEENPDTNVTNQGFFGKKMKAAPEAGTNTEQEVQPKSEAHQTLDTYIPEEIRQENQEGNFSVESENDPSSTIDYKDGRMSIDQHEPVETTTVKSKDGKQYIIGFEEPQQSEDGTETGDAVIAMPNEDGTVEYARYTRDESKVDEKNQVYPYSKFEQALKAVSSEFEEKPVVPVKEIPKVTAEQKAKSEKQAESRGKASRIIQEKKKDGKEQSETMQTSKHILEHFGLSQEHENTTANIENVNRARGKDNAKPRAITNGVLHIPQEAREVKHRESDGKEEIAVSEKNLRTYNMKDKAGNKYLMAVKNPSVEYEYENGKAVLDDNGKMVPKVVTIDGEHVPKMNGQATLVMLNEDGTQSAHTQNFYYQLNSANPETALSWDDLHALKEKLGLQGDVSEEKTAEQKAEPETAKFPHAMAKAKAKTIAEGGPIGKTVTQEKTIEERVQEDPNLNPKGEDHIQPFTKQQQDKLANLQNRRTRTIAAIMNDNRKLAPGMKYVCRVFPVVSKRLTTIFRRALVSYHSSPQEAMEYAKAFYDKQELLISNPKKYKIIYASEIRQQLLSKLQGMVDKWNQYAGKKKYILQISDKPGDTVTATVAGTKVTFLDNRTIKDTGVNRVLISGARYEEALKRWMEYNTNVIAAIGPLDMDQYPENLEEAEIVKFLIENGLGFDLINEFLIQKEKDLTSDEIIDSHKKSLIAFLIGGKTISKESFISNSDENKITPAISKNYLTEKGGQRIDTMISESDAEKFGITITDIVNFIIEHENGTRDYFDNLNKESDIADKISEEFESRYGFPLTINYANNVTERFNEYAEQADKYAGERGDETSETKSQESEADTQANEKRTSRPKPLVISASVFNNEYNTKLRHSFIAILLNRFGQENPIRVKNVQIKEYQGKPFFDLIFNINNDVKEMKGDYVVRMYNKPGGDHATIEKEDMTPENLAKWKVMDTGTETFNGKVYNHVLKVYNQNGVQVGTIAETNQKATDTNKFEDLNRKAKAETGKGIIERIIDELTKFANYMKNRKEKTLRNSRTNLSSGAFGQALEYLATAAIEHGTRATIQFLKSGLSVADAVQRGFQMGKAYAVKSRAKFTKNPIPIDQEKEFDDKVLRAIAQMVGLEKEDLELLTDEQRDELKEFAANFDSDGRADKMKLRFKHLFVNPATGETYVSGSTVNELMDMAWELAKNAPESIGDIRQYYIDNWPSDNAMGSYWKNSLMLQEGKNNDHDVFFQSGFDFMHMTLKNIRRYPHLAYMNQNDKKDVNKGFFPTISNTKRTKTDIATDVRNTARQAKRSIEIKYAILQQMVAEVKGGKSVEEVMSPDKLLTFSPKQQGHLKIGLTALKEGKADITADQLYFASYKGLTQKAGADLVSPKEMQGKFGIVYGQLSKLMAKMSIPQWDITSNKNNRERFMRAVKSAGISSNVNAMIEAGHNVLAAYTGIPAEYWKAFDESYADRFGFNSVEEYVVQMTLAPKRISSKMPNAADSTSFIPSLRFVLHPNKNTTDDVLLVKDLIRSIDPANTSTSQLAEITKGLKIQEEKHPDMLSSHYSDTGGKKVASDEFLSSLTKDLEDAENAQEEHPGNAWVNHVSQEGVVIARIDGVNNLNTRESANRAKLTDFDRLMISLANFVRAEHIVGQGRYLQMLDQQSDSSSALYAVSAQKRNLSKEQVIDILTGYKYYTAKNPLGTTMDKTVASKMIEKQIDEVSKWLSRYASSFEAILSLPGYEKSDSRNDTFEEKRYALAEQFVFNWIANKADIDNYLYGKENKRMAYRESIKRKKDHKGVTCLQGVPGGVGKTQRLVVFSDPILSKIFIGDKIITGDKFKQEYTDGQIILMPWHNKQIQNSTGGKFGGLIKAGTYWNDKNGNNNLLKGNDVSLPDVNDPGAVDFYSKNPFIKELVLWAQANNIDRIAFTSSTKLNKESLVSTVKSEYWDIDEKNMVVKGFKLNGTQTTAEFLDEHVIQAGKVTEVPMDNYRIMLDQTNEGGAYKSKLPSQFINVLRSTRVGKDIDALITKATDKKRTELVRLLQQGNSTIAKEIVANGPQSEEANMLLDALKDKSVSIHDPVLLNAMERYFRNIVERRLLDLVGPKSLATQIRIPGFTEVKPMTATDKTVEHGTIHVAANLQRSEDNPNGVEIGDYVIMTRVPTDDMHSVQVVRVGGYLPASMKNSVISDSVSVYSNGGDFDGDQSHLWTKYKGLNGKPIKGTDTYEGVINSIFDKIVELYSDPESVKRMTRPISVHRVDRIKTLLGYEAESLHPLSWSDWRYMCQANNSSKEVLSMTAATLKTTYNLAAAKVTAKQILIPVYDFETGRWEERSNSLNGWANEELMLENLKELADQENYAADDVKNGTLSVIGKDSNNAGIIDFVISQNHHALESIVMLLKHPVIKAYFMMKDWKKSPLGKSKKRDGMNVWEATLSMLNDNELNAVTGNEWTTVSLPYSSSKFERPKEYKLLMSGNVDVTSLGKILQKPYNQLKFGEKVQILGLLKMLLDGSNELSNANKFYNLNVDSVESFGDYAETMQDLEKNHQFKIINKAEFSASTKMDMCSRAENNLDMNRRFFMRIPILSTFGRLVIAYVRSHNNPFKSLDVKMDAQDFNKVKSAFDQWRCIEALKITETKKELFDQVDRWYESLDANSPMREYLKVDIDRIVLNPEYRNKVDEKSVRTEMNLAFEALPQEVKQMLLKYQVREHGWTNTAWRGGFYHLIGPVTKQSLQVKLEAVSAMLNSEYKAVPVAEQIMKSMDGLIQYEKSLAIEEKDGLYDVKRVVDNKQYKIGAQYIKTYYKGQMTFFEAQENGLYKKIGEGVLAYEIMPVFDTLIPDTEMQEEKRPVLQSENNESVKASIPQNKVSGVESFGSLVHASDKVKKVLGPNPHSIDMIEAGLRTRTTRSESEMAKYAVKVGDVVKQFGKSADGTTKNILTRITAIHLKGTPGFLATWNKEGWSQESIKAIEKFKDGAAAIEFEIIDENKNISGQQLGFDFMTEEKTPVDPVNPKQAEKIRQRLAKLYPWVKFFTNANEFQAWAKKNGATENLDMKAIGARFKNAYWINPEKAHQEAYFHENAHIYWDMVEDTDPVKQRLVSLFNGDTEAAVTAIGRVGVDLSGPILKRFTHYMKLFWARVRHAIWGNATAKDYARIMADRVWRGSDIDVDFTRLTASTYEYMRSRPNRLQFTEKEHQLKEIGKYFEKLGKDVNNLTANDYFYDVILRGRTITNDESENGEDFWIDMFTAVGTKPLNKVEDDLGGKETKLDRNQFVQDILGDDITALRLDELKATDEVWNSLNKKIFGTASKPQNSLFSDFQEIMTMIDGLTSHSKAEFEAYTYDELKKQLDKIEGFMKKFSSNSSKSTEVAPSLEAIRGMRTIILARLSATMLEKGMKEESATDDKTNKVYTEAVYGMTILDDEQVKSHIMDHWTGNNNAGSMTNPNHVQNRFVQLANQIMNRAEQTARNSHEHITEKLDRVFTSAEKSNLGFDDITYVISNDETGKRNGVYYVAPGSTKYNELKNKNDAKSKAIIDFADSYHEVNLEYNTMELIHLNEDLDVADGRKMDRVAFMQADVPELAKKYGWVDAMVTSMYGNSMVDLIHTGIKTTEEVPIDENAEFVFGQDPGTKTTERYITLREYKEQQTKLRDQKKISQAEYVKNIRKEQHKAEAIYQSTASRDSAECPIIRNKIGSMLKGIQFSEDLFTATGVDKPGSSKNRMKALRSASDKYFTEMSFIRELGDSKMMIDFTEEYLKRINNKENATLAIMFRNMKEWRLYGKGVERSKLPLAWQRYLKMLIELTGLRFLALNLPAAVLNAETGIVQNMREIGIRKVMVGFMRVVLNPKKFIRLLQENGIVELTKDWSTSESTRAWGKLKGFLFSPIAAVEFFNHGMTMAGMMTADQWNSYDSNGKVKAGHEKNALTKDQWISLIYQENEFIHGAYHTFNRRMVSSTPEGRAAIQMRTWMPSIWQLHFGEDKYVGAVDAKNIGIVTAAQKNAGTVLKYLGALARMDSKQADQYMSTIPEHHKDAMGRGIYEIVMMAMLALAGASVDGDDRKSMWYTKLGRLISDLGFVYDINNFTGLLKQPVPVASTILEILNTTKELLKFSVGQGETYKQNSMWGDIGDSKMPYYIVNLAPGSQLIKSGVKMMNK